MFCMGHDDRPYRNESSVEIHHSRLPVKGAKHRCGGKLIGSQAEKDENDNVKVYNGECIQIL